MDAHTSPCLAVLAAAASLLAGCTSDAGSPAPESQPEVPSARVLFQGQGRSHLLVGQASLDGSDISYPLANFAGGDQTNPDWSPDGSHMVFVVNDGARDDLWIARADGSMPRTLLDCRGECRYLDDPAWSPNGAEVVYSRTTARGSSGLGSLETVDLATGAVTMLLPPRFRRFTAGARWSPFGSYVVYESVHTDSRRLDAEVDGVSLRIATWGSHEPGRALTEPLLFAATADWSPDGTQIVYAGLTRPDAEASDLFVVPADGGAPRQLTHLVDAGGYAQEPDWSGDGSRIVFSGRLTDRAGSAVLLVVPADGSAAPADLGATAVIGRHPRVEPGA
jgi:Tol biopolymer transport system component